VSWKIRLYFKSFREIVRDGLRPIFCLRVEKVVEPAVAGMGYELVDVQASNGGRLLRLFIDKPGGVTLGDCAAISRHLTRVLAVEGIDYERLEVSSPGLDRPLRKEKDFVRFAGQKAEIRMRTPDASGRRRFVGVLRGAEAGRVSMELEGQTVALALDDVDRAKLIPELK
jgi:ribosome maturation factor RimP